MLAGHAELAAHNVPTSDQIVVWVPRKRGILSGVLLSALHQEREAALYELMQLRLICYAERGCSWVNTSPALARAAVHETGVRPEQWRVTCPSCGSVAGPDLAPVRRDPIVKRWIAAGKPVLENPAASAAFRSTAPVHDLPAWIEKSDPSHLELAYLAQQMWPTIGEMLEACTAA
jgi:hypothetical protein